jgi:hypothetical protein
MGSFSEKYNLRSRLNKSNNEQAPNAPLIRHIGGLIANPLPDLGGKGAVGFSSHTL